MSLPHGAMVDLKPVIEAFSGVSIYSRVFLKTLILAVYQISAVYVKKRIEPWQEISNNVVCATSKGSDQPAHTRSLIRAFACR